MAESTADATAAPSTSSAADDAPARQLVSDVTGETISGNDGDFVEAFYGAFQSCRHFPEPEHCTQAQMREMSEFALEYLNAANSSRLRNEPTASQRRVAAVCRALGADLAALVEQVIAGTAEAGAVPALRGIGYAVHVLPECVGGGEFYVSDEFDPRQFGFNLATMRPHMQFLGTSTNELLQELMNS